MKEDRLILIEQLKSNDCPMWSHAAGVIYGQGTFIDDIEKHNEALDEEISSLQDERETFDSEIEAYREHTGELNNRIRSLNDALIASGTQCN